MGIVRGWECGSRFDLDLLVYQSGVVLMHTVGRIEEVGSGTLHRHV